MLKRIIELSKLLTVLIIVDALLCLLYFWAAMLSYSLWLSDAVLLALPVTVRTAEVHFHGPSILALSIIGILSPFITSLPFTLFWSFIRKLPTWVKYSLCIIWLGEIVALGFFVPRLTSF